MKESWLRKSENGGNSSSLAKVLAKFFVTQAGPVFPKFFWVILLFQQGGGLNVI